MAHVPVSPDEFERLDGLDDWHYADGAIQSTYDAGSFPAGGALIGEIAGAAEAVNHHPDLTLRWPGHVGIVLTTHDAGGLTTADIDLARSIAALASTAGATAVQA